MFFTQERRLAALQEIQRILKPGGHALVYVWAFEQDLGGKSKYLKDSKIRKKTEILSAADSVKEVSQTCSVKLEVSNSQPVVLATDDCDSILRKGDAKPGDDSSICELKTDNLVVHTNKTHFEQQDVLVPWHLKNKERQKSASHDKKENQTATVYHRFYHVYKCEELENDWKTVGGVEIIKNYYDNGNWCTVVRKIE